VEDRHHRPDPAPNRRAEVGFDLIELSAGFVSLPVDDWLRLIERVQRAGLKAKPEVGIQFGAGGGSTAAALLTPQADRRP
jgi:phosphosulfolactate synthase (CoM biosynthesis protein A)